MTSSEHRKSDSGAVAVLTAVLAVVLFGMAAFVVDLGIARDNRRQAQNTADAAALAAANALYATTAPRLNQPGDFDGAVDAAKSYAAENYGTTESEWASCTTDQALDFVWSSAGTNCISFDSELYPRQALVVVPIRKQPTMFGGIFGYTGVNISALAQAQLDPGGARICTFCVLGDEEHRIQNGNLTVSGGNMWFNGSVFMGPNGYAGSTEGYVTGEDGSQILDGGNAYVEGTINGTGGSKFQGGAGQTGQPRIVDPLAADELPFATQEGLPRYVSGNPCTDGPGVYHGYRSSSDEDCDLDPGLYVFTDDFELSGKGALLAQGATFYFTCGDDAEPRDCEPGETGASMQITGQGGYVLEAPLRSTYPELPEELYGYAIVYDRYNEGELRLAGNAASTVSGTIYAYSSEMRLSGEAGTDVPFSSMIVVGSVRFDGTNATLNVVFDSTKNRRPSEGDRGLVR